MRLLNLSVTTPCNLTSAVFQSRDGSPHDICLQANFTVVGSPGSSVDAYVQTSADGGDHSWMDVANFEFTTSSAGPLLFNLSSETPITSQLVTTDGALTANTCISGLLCPLWRVRYVVVGSYAGGTSLTIDAACSHRLEQLSPTTAWPLTNTSSLATIGGPSLGHPALVASP
jgi:hypothetical protein